MRRPFSEGVGEGAGGGTAGVLKVRSVGGSEGDTSGSKWSAMREEEALSAVPDVVGTSSSKTTLGTTKGSGKSGSRGSKKSGSIGSGRKSVSLKKSSRYCF